MPHKETVALLIMASLVCNQATETVNPEGKGIESILREHYNDVQSILREHYNDVQSILREHYNDVQSILRKHYNDVQSILREHYNGRAKYPEGTLQ